VIPVHFGGLACDIASIRTIAAKHGIAVVEDAAHALPSRSAGELVGSRSEYACFSFYATKNLTTGEGGAFVTSDENIADRVRRLSLHGLSRDAWKRYESAGSWYYEIEEPGFKYNMTDIAAAMGLAQLRRLPALHAEREHLAGLYDEAFSLTDWLNPQPQTPADEHGHHLYVLRLNPARLLIGRDKFIEALNAENIGTSVHFIPLHMHTYYRDRFEFPSEAFPGSLALYEQAISLPMYPGLSSLAQNDVINAVMKIGSAYAR
jgi:perosamine synthetase